MILTVDLVCVVLKYLLVGAVLIAYLGIFLAILLENRNTAKTSAYILLLLFLPIVGIIVFYFFGRDYRRKIKLGIKHKLDEKTIRELREKLISQQEQSLNKLEGSFGSLANTARMLFNAENSLLLSGNKVKLLVNGEAKFPELFKAIQEAKHHIHLQYYILSDDDIGKELTNLLIEKAKQGLQVRVLVDGAASSKAKRIAKVLKHNGVQFSMFLPVRFASAASPNYRNHRKIVVIDGHTGFIGGLNMDDRYINNGKHSLYWRDTHLKIEGNAVYSLQMIFRLDWEFASKEIIPFEKPFFSMSLEMADTTPISIASSGPVTEHAFGMDSMVNLINQAKTRVCITNPYFIPSEVISNAIITASLSGTKVQLMLPGVSDSVLVQRASNSYLKPLLRAGVEVFFYQKGFLHAKTMTIDNEVSMIGSLNADIRSFYINYEATAIVYDKELTAELNKVFEADLKDCSLITKSDWEKRSIYTRLMDSICRLISPIL